MRVVLTLRHTLRTRLTGAGSATSPPVKASQCVPRQAGFARDLGPFGRAANGTPLEEGEAMGSTRPFLSSLTRPLTLASFLGLALLAACGGAQLGGGPDGGNHDGGVFTEPDGATCVDIDPSSYDQSCTTSSDCVAITSGTVCSTSCLCGGSTINKSGEARYQAALSQVSSGGITCPCPFSGEPECLHGTCIICSSIGPKGPECSDGGTTGSDGSTDSSTDSSTGDENVAVDAGQCVDIDPSTYDQTCNNAADCFLIQTGEVCSGSCACGGTPVNVSGEARYDKAVSGIKFAECPCASKPVGCVAGTCAFCGPDGCSDGG
jgi:hypothetical protein